MNPIDIAILAGIAVLIWLVFTRGKARKDDASTLMMQEQLKEMRGTLDTKLGEIPNVIQKQFGESAKIIRNVTEKLTKLDETNKQVVGFADQLKSLQDILKNPKQRGVLGEYYLETVLKNLLPPGSYQMQYSFKDGSIVDAVIFYEKRIIPIDSKFSLENYERILDAKDSDTRKKYENALRDDLKIRIEETSKYIKPAEDTIEFAFMFIPSEALYYDLVVNKIGVFSERTLIEYAVGEKKVIPVSPTSFAAYLQTVIQGLRQVEFKESVQDIIKNVGKLGKHLSAYDVHMQKLGKNISASVNAYSNAYKEFKKVDKDVLKISGEAIDIEPMVIEASVHDEE